MRAHRLRLGKRSKISHALKLDVQLDGTIEGSLTIRKPHRKKKNTTVINEGLGVEAGAAMPGSEALAGDWVNQFGNTGYGHAEGKSSLVASGSEARLQWVSDVQIPHSRGPNTRGKSRPQEPGMTLSEGWSSPLISNNKVFLNYYKPSGDIYVLGAKPVANDPMENSRFDMMRLHTDEYLHAFDALSGRTAWTLRIKDRGINWMGFNKGGPGTTAAIGDGLVVWINSIGEVFAADQETGALRWSSSIGMRHEIMQEERRLYRERSDLYNSRNDFQGAVVIADGVAVVPDQSFSKGGGKYRYEFLNGLRGLDLQTGKLLWELPEINGRSRFQQGAQLWQHGDSTYIVAASVDRTSIINPKDGKIIAEIPGLINAHWGLSFSPDTIVGDLLSDAKDPRSEKVVAAFRLSNGQVEKRWQLDARYRVRPGGGVYMNGHFYLQSKGDFHGIICVEAESGKVVAEEPCEVGGGEHSPFIVGAGNRLIAALDRTAGLIFLDANPDKLSGSAQVWRLSLATGYCGSVVPAIVDGRMIIRTPDRLLSYDLRSK